MQANEFEKKIQNKMEGFTLVPGEEVWNQVAARIGEEKKRRRYIFFWFFSGFLLLSGATGWWYLTKENKAVPPGLTTSDQHSSPQKNTPLQKPAETKRTYAERKNKQNKNADKISMVKEKKSNTSQHKIIKENNSAKRNDRQLASSKINSKRNKVITKNIPFKETTARNVIDNKPSDQFSANINTGKATNGTQGSIADPNKLSKQDSGTATLAIEEKAKLEKDTSVSTVSANKALPGLKKQKTKKWTFGFTTFAGVSDNVSGFPIISENKSLSYDASPTNVGSPGGGFVSGIVPLSYTSGFSWGIGAYTTLHIKKKFGLSLGVNYHYYSAQSSVGSRVSAPLSLFDSVLQQSVSRDGFYYNGTSVAHRNTYHFIEMPINLLFRINKSENKPLLLTAGISPGYMAGSNALYANQSERIYYVEKDQFRRFQLSAQAGLLITFINAKRFRFNAGPVLQYSITNIARPITGTHQHLLFTGLKTNISLK